MDDFSNLVDAEAGSIWTAVDNGVDGCLCTLVWNVGEKENKEGRGVVP